MSEVLQILGELDQTFRQANDQVAKDLKEHGTVLSQTREKLEKIEQDIDKLENQHNQRLDDIELRLDAPAQQRGNISDVEKRHVDAWETWMRNPHDRKNESALLEATAKVDEHFGRKAVTTTVSASGGYAVPEVISRMIGEKVQDISDMRRIVRVQQVGTSDYKELIDINGESSGWVGETGTRSETNTPSLAEVAPTMGTLYAYPKTTEESLDDIFFDVQGWLVRKVSVAFAKAEGIAFVSGDGSNKPTGFLNATPESTNDEELVGSPAAGRTFGALQYVPTGAAAGFLNNPTGSPFSYGADVFIDIEQELKPEYRRNAVYLMNKSTLKEVRKFKDADGNYIWQRSLILGQPSTINGYPVYEMEAMPSLGANAFPVALGDFMEGYLAVDRVGLRMSIDSNITTPGYVKYYVRKRQGGKTYNDDAIKLIKCATS